VRRVRTAVVLGCSVKTLPVAVVVLTKLEELIGVRAGLAVVACVLCHLSQVRVFLLCVSD
jgi:hypothetical protein